MEFYIYKVVDSILCNFDSSPTDTQTNKHTYYASIYRSGRITRPGVEIGGSHERYMTLPRSRRKPRVNSVWSPSIPQWQGEHYNIAAYLRFIK